jgi:DMSO reductase family type II enzyme chaperone
MNSVGLSDSLTVILARSFTYQRLAVGFRYPHEEVYTLLAGPSLYEDLHESCTILGYTDCAQNVSKLGTNAVLALAGMESAYLDAFEDTDGRGKFCPLYEGTYRPDLSRSKLLVELKALYHHFGLLLAAEDNELPDHVTAELEFMHFLALKEAQCLESGSDAAPYIRAQRDMGAHHLQPWFRALASPARSLIPEGFYRHWVELTSDFISLETFT